MSKEVEHFVQIVSKQCNFLMQSPLPLYPWEKVASDLFKFKKRTYILVVDYFQDRLKFNSFHHYCYSIEVFIFSPWSTTLVTDNGPQYVSQEMNQFSATYGFNHITSSPYYAQSNSLAERTVKIKTYFPAHLIHL